MQNRFPRIVRTIVVQNIDYLIRSLMGSQQNDLLYKSVSEKRMYSKSFSRRISCRELKFILMYKSGIYIN